MTYANKSARELLAEKQQLKLKKQQLKNPLKLLKNNDPNFKAYPFRIYKVQSNEATCC